MKRPLADLRVRPKRRANGSPRTGETSADLLRSVPTSFPTAAPAKQPSWRDLEAYDPQVLSAAAGRGMTNALEGTKQLFGGARDYLGGFMQSVREKSPVELQGTAPARSKETYASVNRTVSEAAQDPLTTAKNLASAFVDVGVQATKSPASTTEFIADILAPIPGPSIRGTPPVLRMAEETGADTTRMQQMVAQQFSGRLDDFVSKLKGPVQKDQFLGQLSNKFRSYEIDRAKQALSDLPGNARLTPQELAEKLAATLSPTDLTTKIIPPREAGFYRSYDNPYPERPLGIIHLNKQANISPEEMTRLEGLDQLKKVADITPSSLFGVIGPDFKQDVLKAVRDSGADTATTRSTVERLSGQLDEVASLHDEAKRYSDIFKDYNTAFTIPGALKTRLPGQDYPVYNELVSTLRGRYDKAQRDKGEFVASFDNYEKASRLATKVVFMDSLNGFLRQVEPYIKQAGTVGNETLQAFDQLKDVQDLIKRNPDWVRDPDYVGPTTARDTQDLIKLGESIKLYSASGFGMSVNDSLFKTISLLSKAAETWRLGPYEKRLTETASTLRGLLKSAEERGPPLYRGQHPTLEGGINPVAFSRFSEHTADIPGLGTGVRGIYVNELQSDLLQDVRQLGAKGRTAEMDQIELDRLTREQSALRGRINQGIRGENFTDPEDLENLKDELRRNIKRQEILGKRLRKANPSSFSSRLGRSTNMYQLPEPFAGMETSPAVLQQLLIKNVIGAAARRGDSFVAFPGVQSKQAQLYKNLPNNLKQVLKDLGPGFDVRMITLPSAKGEPFTHPAVVWGPEAAARVTQKGIPFAQGGEVKALAKSY